MSKALGMIGAAMLGGLAGAGNAVATIGKAGVEQGMRLDLERELSAMREQQQLRIEETLAERKQARAQEAGTAIQQDIDARVASESAKRNVPDDQAGPNWQPSAEEKATYGYESAIARGNAEQATLYGGLIDRHMKDKASARDDRKLEILDESNAIREKEGEQRHEEALRRYDLLQQQIAAMGAKGAGRDPADVASAKFLRDKVGDPEWQPVLDLVFSRKGRNREDAISEMAMRLISSSNGMKRMTADQAVKEATRMYDVVHGPSGAAGQSAPSPGDPAAGPRMKPGTSGW